MGSSALSSCPALRPRIRPKRVLHLVVSALSRLRPPGSTVQAADPQTPIGLQSRLLLRLWPQELPCSTVASGLRNFLHSRPPQHAMPLGLRPRPPPTPPGQPEEGRLQKKLLRRTHGQRAPRHPSDRGYQMVHLHWHQHHTHPGWGQSVRWSREVPCSALKGETVPDSLPATPKSPPTRRVPPRGTPRVPAPCMPINHYL